MGLYDEEGSTAPYGTTYYGNSQEPSFGQLEEGSEDSSHMPDAMIGRQVSSGLNIESMYPDFLKGNRRKFQPGSIKEFENKPAVLYIIDKKTKLIRHMTNKFYLTNHEETYSERAQIMESFSNPNFFFFGPKTPVHQFSGNLLESESVSSAPHKYLWASSLRELYKQHMRATVCAERGHEVLLSVENSQLFGYVVNLKLGHGAQNDSIIGFTFSMIIRDQRTINTDANELFSLEQNIKDEDKRKRAKSLEQEIKTQISERDTLRDEAFIKVLETGLNLPNTFEAVAQYLETGEIQEFVAQHSGYQEIPIQLQSEQKDYTDYEDTIEEKREAYMALFRYSGGKDSLEG